MIAVNFITPGQSAGKTRTRTGITIAVCILTAGFALFPSALSASGASETWEWSPTEPSVASQPAPKTESNSAGLVHYVRIDRSKWRFSPFSHTTDSNGQRLTASEWQTLTGAAFVINAGQYDTAQKHLGWFIRDSHHLGSRKHPLWKGLLVGGSKSGRGGSGMEIVDLEMSAPPLPSTPDTNIVQSLMLFDRRGAIRVNKTTKSARRCVLAEGRDQYFYIILTEGEWTLWDLANYLLNSSLGLKHSMSLDGGAQAQIALKTQDQELVLPRFQMALPCVIGFFPIAPEIHESEPDPDERAD